LKEDLSATELVDDKYMARFIEKAFPDKVRSKYRKPLYRHRLCREILATQLANDMVNTMGISFAQRLVEATGASISGVAKAYVCARDIYAMEDFHKQLEALDYKVPAALQVELMTGMMRRVRRAARWFLRNRRSQLNPATEVEVFKPAIAQLQRALPDLLHGEQLADWQQRGEQLRTAGLPEELALRSAAPGHLYSGLGVAEAARRCGANLLLVANLYYAIAHYLGLHWFSSQISDVSVDNYWQAMARESYLDDVESQLRTLTTSLVRFVGDDCPVEEVVTRWAGQHQHLIRRWTSMRAEVESGGATDFAIFSVALRELLDLAQVTQHCETLDAESPACGMAD
jgi:glutamate dehydrogenase